MRFTSIEIIYNPKSTGDSHEAAKTFRKKLTKQYPDISVIMHATEYAGDAEEIAYKCAKSTSHPLLISSSGDGGYNEVVNGAIKAQLEGANPICAVLPAGNANDHSRALQKQPLYDAIIKGKIKSLDLLKATIKKGDKTTTRYAHSYIGLGLTPVVAVELNQTKLNFFKELWIVLKTFYRFRPVRILAGNKILKLDSIIFSNIDRMAKVLTVAKNAKPDDGLFEIAKFPHAHKIRLLHRLAKASTTGLEQKKQVKEFSFRVLKKTPVQFDGEVQIINKNSKVTITSENKLLKTVI